MKPCPSCNGHGLIVSRDAGWRFSEACPACIGRGTLPTTPQEVKKRAAVIRSERLTSALHPPPTLIVIHFPNTEASA